MVGMLVPVRMPQIEAAAESEWVEVHDRDRGEMWYFNPVTQQSQWEVGAHKGTGQDLGLYKALTQWLRFGSCIPHLPPLPTLTTLHPESDRGRPRWRG